MKSEVLQELRRGLGCIALLMVSRGGRPISPKAVEHLCVCSPKKSLERHLLAHEGFTIHFIRFFYLLVTWPYSLSIRRSSYKGAFTGSARSSFHSICSAPSPCEASARPCTPVVSEVGTSLLFSLSHTLGLLSPGFVGAWKTTWPHQVDPDVQCDSIIREKQISLWDMVDTLKN